MGKGKKQTPNGLIFLEGLCLSFAVYLLGQLLVTLLAVKGALAKELLIQKPVTIPGAGSYLKDFTAPLYGRGVMAELAKGEKGCGPCVGVLAKEKKAPKGYVRRRLGIYELCLPVYPRESFNFLLWKPLGYLPAGEGYLTVAKPRVGYWVCLGLAALAAFCLAYWCFRFGTAAVVDGLAALPETILDNCLRVLHEWGVI